MATFKFDAEFRFGKYYAHLRSAGDPKPDLTKQPALESAKDVSDFLNDEIVKPKLSDDDYIILRNNAYEDFDQLADEIRRASY